MNNEQYPAQSPKFLEGREGILHCSFELGSGFCNSELYSPPKGR